MHSQQMAELNVSNEVTFEDILSTCGLAKERLQQECSREVVLEIATKLKDWKMMGNYLNMPSEKLKAIELENHTEDQRKVAMLDTWCEKEGTAASYWKLTNALYRHGRRDLIESLCKAIAGQSPESPPTKRMKVLIESGAMMDTDRWDPDPESSKYSINTADGNNIYVWGGGKGSSLSAEWYYYNFIANYLTFACTLELNLAVLFPHVPKCITYIASSPGASIFSTVRGEPGKTYHMRDILWN